MAAWPRCGTEGVVLAGVAAGCWRVLLFFSAFGGFRNRASEKLVSGVLSLASGLASGWKRGLGSRVLRSLSRPGAGMLAPSAANACLWRGGARGRT